MDRDVKPPNASGPIRRGLQGVLNVIAALGTIWIFVIMLLIVGDVVGRNLLGMPIVGVAEIAARSVVAIVFMMLPAAALSGTLVRADFLVRGLRKSAPGASFLLDVLFGLTGAVMFALVAVAAWPDTLGAWKSSEFFGVRGVWTLPTLPFRLIVVLGSAATSTAFLVAAFDTQPNKVL